MPAPRVPQRTNLPLPGIGAGVGCNVANEDEVAAMVEKTVNAFGRLDAAFNNAGVQSPAIDTADASGEEFDRVIAINLRGVWNCMKHELRQMRGQGSGAIVNCSSIAASLDYRAGPRITQPSMGCSDLPRARRSSMHPGAFESRSVPWNDRHADGLGHVGQGARCHEGNHARSAYRASGSAGGDRLGRSLALQPGAGFVIGHALAVDGGFTAH